MNNKILIALGFILVFVIAFFIGARFSAFNLVRRGMIPNYYSSNGFPMRRKMNGWGGSGMMNFGNSNLTTNATVSNISGNSLIVQYPNGRQIVYNLTNQTTVNKTISDNKNGLKNGQKVVVTGLRNQNGSLDAQSIIIVQ